MSNRVLRIRSQTNIKVRWHFQFISDRSSHNGSLKNSILYYLINLFRQKKKHMTRLLLRNFSCKFSFHDDFIVKINKKAKNRVKTGVFHRENRGFANLKMLHGGFSRGKRGVFQGKTGVFQ